MIQAFNNKQLIKIYLAVLCAITALIHLAFFLISDIYSTGSPKGFPGGSYGHENWDSLLMALVSFGISAKITNWLLRYFRQYSITSDFNKAEIITGCCIYGLAMLFCSVTLVAVRLPVLATIVEVVIPMCACQWLFLLQYSNRIQKLNEQALKTLPIEQSSPVVSNNAGAAERGLTNQPVVLPQSVIPTNDTDERFFYDTHGTSHWITDNKKEELTDVLHDDTQEDKIKSGVGLWIGGGFFNHREGNLCTIAPPGKGKGAALILPNLLWQREYEHSFVVFDPKGTNACVTAKYQSQKQKVIIIDPMGLQELNGATHGIKPSSYNPLEEITDIYSGVAIIARLLLPDPPKDDIFWAQRGRDLMQGILMHILTDEIYESERDLTTLYRLIKRADFRTLFDEMRLNYEINNEIKHCAEEFRDLYINSDKTFYSILASISGAINWLGNPAIQKFIKKSDFKAADLDKGGITLYLCQPITDKEQFATFSRLVVGTILRLNVRPSSKPKAWVYYLLDEFPSMGVFPEVIDSLALAREYKMRIWLFMQSIAQLNRVYGDNGFHGILGNVTILQSIGVTDKITQDYISQRIGDKTQSIDNNSTTAGSQDQTTYTNSRDERGGSTTENRTYNTSSSRTSNYSTGGRKLILPEELEREPHIVTLTEWGAMRLYKWQYWQNGQDEIASEYFSLMNEEADPNPNFR